MRGLQSQKCKMRSAYCNFCAIQHAHFAAQYKFCFSHALLTQKMFALCKRGADTNIFCVADFVRCIFAMFLVFSYVFFCNFLVTISHLIQMHTFQANLYRFSIRFLAGLLLGVFGQYAQYLLSQFVCFDGSKIFAP